MQLQPYMDVATRLGRVLCRMTEGPVSDVEVGVFGAAGRLDTHSISSSAMVGLLCEHLSVPVNNINALHLARRQGIHVTETSSEESSGYVSLIRITARTESETIALEGTVFDEQYARLVRVNGYEVESPLDGHLLITRHADRPGVIGALGELLGQRGINISRMQVGVADGKQFAIAVLAVSKGLDADALAAIEQIEAVDKVLQISL